jgi:hypothetical protein
LRSAAILVVAVALGGCGGGGDGGRLSDDEYRRRADAICAQANADLRALEPPGSLEAMKDFVDQAKPIAQGAVDRFDELEPPADLEAAHDRWVQQNRRVVVLLGKVADAQNLPDAASNAREFDRVTKETNETARDDLGLDDCGPENG